MVMDSAAKTGLRVWASLASTLALLLLSLTLMALLAQAEPSGAGQAAPADQAQARQAGAGVRLPQLQARVTTTDPLTATALLPLAVQGHDYPPPPLPWRGEVTDRYQNCGLTRLFGFTLDQDGELLGDVWVHYWADGWDGAWAKSSWEAFGSGQDDDGNWDGVLDNRPRSVVWHVCVAPKKNSFDCLSNVVDAETSANCGKGYQVIAIDFRQN
jgi:hypothetical protein